MLHSKAHLRFHFRVRLKSAKMRRKYSFYAAVDDPLDSTIKGASKGALEDAPNIVFSDLPKEAQNGALKVALKGAPVVALFDTIINSKMCTKWLF